LQASEESQSPVAENENAQAPFMKSDEQRLWQEKRTRSIRCIELQ